MPLFFLFCIGLAVGSFLNVVILRHREGRLPSGRSACMRCQKILRWFELIPVFSYLIQRGRCRSCRAPLTAQYPLVELSTAILFVAVFVRVVGSSSFLELSAYTLLSLTVHLVLWSTLIVIFVYDLQTKIIPDRFNFVFAVSAGVAVLLVSGICTGFDGTGMPVSVSHAWTTVLAHVLAGILLFLPFYGLWRYSEGRWIGLGDGKLAVGIGLLFGLEAGVSAVMFGFWIGAIVTLGIMGVERVLRALHVSKSGSAMLSLKSEIPLGPFLIIGVAIVYFTELTFRSFW